jgi:hypothetical protein
VAANKLDAVDDEARVKSLEKRVKKAKLPFFRISGVTGAGVDQLLETAWRQIAVVRENEAAAALVADEDDGQGRPSASEGGGRGEPRQRSQSARQRSGQPSDVAGPASGPSDPPSDGIDLLTPRRLRRDV